jgi:small multidrug resistance pump
VPRHAGAVSAVDSRVDRFRGRYADGVAYPQANQTEIDPILQSARRLPTSGSGGIRKRLCMSWIWLFVAILLEVAATVCMKLSNGFSRALPTAFMALLYALSFVPMTVALRRLEVGIAYAVWSAVGTALITLIGMWLFRESMSATKACALGLIVFGVIMLNLADRNGSGARNDNVAQIGSEQQNVSAPPQRDASFSPREAPRVESRVLLASERAERISGK